jgi:hypothetical protein
LIAGTISDVQRNEALRRRFRLDKPDGPQIDFGQAEGLFLVDIARDDARRFLRNGVFREKER